MSQYAKEYYGVPADIGRRVIIAGKPGIIAEDRGNYIGVNFDHDKPGVVTNAHPTWRVEYGEMGAIRRPSRSQRRYQRYLEFGDMFEDFRQFLRWDQHPERSWN